MSKRIGPGPGKAVEAVSRSARAALLVWALQAAAPALGLGLGEMQLRSFLNEPLDAEVTLLDIRGLTADDIRVRLGAVEDFDRLGVERSYFLTGIDFEVVVDGSTGVIRLTTEGPVLEPYLDLIIEARWPTGRLLRNYTVLVDPPAFRQEVLTVSASEEVRRSEAPATADAPAAGRAPEAAGDAVTLRESDLAPGEMPARPFSAETSAQPRAGSRYLVKRDETLWQIASRARPSGTSVQQAMLDIQRLNPEAFIDGNINRIKAGYIIYLPDSGDISSDDLASALEEVREQNQAFQSRRAEPGVTAAASLRVSADTGVTDEPDAERGTGTASAQAPGVPDAGVTAAPATTQELAGLEADDVASAELAAQLDAMAARLDTLEQIVALKDQQIATLEQALREAREAQEAAATGTAAPAPEAAPAPAPAARPAPTPPPPVERPAPVSAVPLWPLVGGVLALVALAVFAVLRRRRSRKVEEDLVRVGSTEDVFAGVSLKREALEPAVATAAVAEAATAAEAETEAAAAAAAAAAEKAPTAAETAAPGGSRGYGERKHDDYIDESAGGDALAEADIYIAYGRYLQAIELLNSAIEDEPDNTAYRLKLIELYVDMGEEKEAEEQLRRLRGSGDKEAIVRAEALVGGGLAPIEYEVPEREAPRAEQPQAPDDEPDMAAGDDAGDTTMDGDEADGDEADDDELPFATDSVAAELDDLETLNLGDGLGAGAEAAEAVGDEDSAEHDGSALLGDDELQTEAIEFEGLQIEDDDAADDFAGDEELDIMAVGDDELDLSEALAEVDAEADEGDSEELVIAEDADQMATKLDLARAYLDMGDGDGARTILEEVMGSGSDEQQQEARELLSRID